MESKLIEYAYPTSTTAKKQEYYKTGCWFVCLYKSINSYERVKDLKFFLTKQEAFNYAETLPNEYNVMHKYFNY